MTHHPYIKNVTFEPSLSSMTDKALWGMAAGAQDAMDKADTVAAYERAKAILADATAELTRRGREA